MEKLRFRSAHALEFDLRDGIRYRSVTVDNCSIPDDERRKRMSSGYKRFAAFNRNGEPVLQRVLTRPSPSLTRARTGAAQGIVPVRLAFAQ
jgi:hypothetical protein